MAEILHLRCRHCNNTLMDKSTPYCPPCNLLLFYRAMPILLGMLMTRRTGPRQLPEVIPVDRQGNSLRKAYAHSRYILD